MIDGIKNSIAIMIRDLGNLTANSLVMEIGLESHKYHHTENPHPETIITTMTVPETGIYSCMVLKFEYPKLERTRAPKLSNCELLVEQTAVIHTFQEQQCQKRMQTP